jgi:hypothetical protein
MLQQLYKQYQQFILWMNMRGIEYDDATIFDYAEGDYSPMTQYQTKDQVLTVLERVISGEENLTIIISFHGGDLAREFGRIVVASAGKCKTFRWIDGIYSFHDAFVDAVTHIKAGNHGLPR